MLRINNTPEQLEEQMCYWLLADCAPIIDAQRYDEDDSKARCEW